MMLIDVSALDVVTSLLLAGTTTRLKIAGMRGKYLLRMVIVVGAVCSNFGACQPNAAQTAPPERTTGALPLCPYDVPSAYEISSKYRVVPSRSARSGNAELLIALLATLSEFRANHTRCVAQPQLVLDEYESVVYVLEQELGGVLRSSVRPDWSVRVGHVLMDDCLMFADGSLAAIMSAVYGSRSQHQHMCRTSNGSVAATTNTTTTSSSSSSGKVFMLLGPATSEVARAVSPLLSVLRMPAISPTATGKEFTCGDIGDPNTRLKCAHSHSLFYRTAPSDLFQARAMVDLMVHFGWKLAVTLASEDIYGSSLMHEFGREAAKRNICIAYSNVIRDSDLDWPDNPIVRAIAARPQARVIVLFAHHSLASRLMHSITEFGMSGQRGSDDLRRVWLGSDAWSGNSFASSAAVRNTTLAAVLSVRLHVNPAYGTLRDRLMAGYKRYLRDRTLNEVRASSNGGDSYADFVCASLQERPDIACSFCNRSCDAHACQERYEGVVDRFDDIHGATGPHLMATWIAAAAARVAMDDIAIRLGRNATRLQLTEAFSDALASESDPVRYLAKVQVECGPPDAPRQCLPFRCLHELPAAYEVRSFAEDGAYRRVGVWAVDITPYLGQLSSTSVGCNDLVASVNRATASWDMNGTLLIAWGGLSSLSSPAPPLSTCNTSKDAARCRDGWQHASDSTGLLLCCVECQLCPNTDYVNISADGTRSCRSCGTAEVPDESRSGCVKATPQSLNMLTAAVLLFVSLAGCLGVAWVALVFHHFSTTPVIKGTDYRFTILHLVGIFGGFLVVVPRAWNPTAAGCLVQEGGGFLFYVMTVSVSLVKTSRFARLVARTSLIDRNNWTFSNRAQATYVAVLCAVGILLYVPWRIVVPPSVGVFERSSGVVYLYCDRVFAQHIVLDAYVALLIVVTCVFGFVTRKLPDNYNEAGQLFMAALSTCLVWLVMSAPYYGRALDNSQADLFLAIRLIGHMWSVLLWMYSYRVYVCVFRPQKNTLERSLTQLGRGSSTTSQVAAVRCCGMLPPLLHKSSATRDPPASPGSLRTTPASSPIGSDESNGGYAYRRGVDCRSSHLLPNTRVREARPFQYILRTTSL